MTCPQCHAENDKDAKFCHSCGADMTKDAAEETSEPKSKGKSIEYAGFWRRVGAYLIDQFLLFVVVFILSAIFGFAFFTVANPNSADPGSMYGAILGVVISWLYYALMESSEKQATFGKQALGLVVTSTDHKRISFGQATGRYFARIISSLILGIGYLMVAFTEKKQGLHDMIASTLVVVKK